MIRIFKYCLVAICLLQSSQLFSQDFISDNKLWSVVSIGSSEVPWVTTTYYKFSGDTTVNYAHYIKLYRSQDENNEKWTLYNLWFEVNNQVYSYWIPTKQTTLIYDFNIGEGDSFMVSEYRTIYVDSVRMFDWGGKLRKHWFFSSHKDAFFDSNKYTVWIEGVGQTGLFTRSTENGITGAFNHLLCYSENGETVFQNPAYNSCWVKSTSTPIIESPGKQIDLYQSDERNLQLKLFEATSGELFLYTIDGRHVFTMMVDQSTSTFPTPTNGILFYRFINKKGVVQTGKIIVK